MDRVWALDANSPVVCERPHYSSVDEGIPVDIAWDGEAWWIFDPEMPDLAYARALSSALHPNTIWAGEWCVSDGHGGWDPLPEFRTVASLESSPERPLLLLELGLDFFVRIPVTRVVYFIDPVTGEARHSGAKPRLGLQPGVRFCPLCWTCTSANNFVSQHMHMHKKQLQALGWSFINDNLSKRL